MIYIVSYCTVIDNLTHKLLKETTIRSQRNTTFRTHKNTFVHHRLPIAFYNLRKTFLISPDLSHGKLFHERRNSFQEFQQKPKKSFPFLCKIYKQIKKRKKIRKFTYRYTDVQKYEEVWKSTKSVKSINLIDIFFKFYIFCSLS